MFLQARMSRLALSPLPAMGSLRSDLQSTAEPTSAQSFCTASIPHEDGFGSHDGSPAAILTDSGAQIPLPDSVSEDILIKPAADP